MRLWMTISFVFVANAAAAHTGHPELLGHPDPWLIGAGIGAIIIAGLLGKKKGKAAKPDPKGEPA